MDRKIAVTMTANAAGLIRGFSSAQAATMQFANSSQAALRSASAEAKRYEDVVGRLGGSSAALGMARRAVGAAVGGMSVASVINMADGWGQYASRIRMATRSTEEYGIVQDRMLQSANRTFRSIEETREGFIQMSPVLRDMGLSLEQSMDAVDAFSGLLVVNSASADKGKTALDAYSKSLQKGKVDADAWATIASTIPSLVELIAKSSGKTAQEVRKLGAEGKMSVQDMTNALVSNLATINRQVEAMPTTVRDALGKLRNGFADYIGWQNEASGATAALASGIGMLGDNMSGVLTAGAVLAGGAIAMYATRLGVATAATVAQGIASSRAAMLQASLTAQFNGTSAAAARASVALRAVNAAMGPAGWIGLAATAAAGMYLFSENTSKAARSAVDLASPLDELKEKFNALTEAQQRTMLTGSEFQIEEGVRGLDTAIKELITGSLADGTKAVAKWRADVGMQIDAAAQAAIDGAMSFRDLSSYLVALATDYAQTNNRSKEWTDQTIALAGKLSEAGLTVEQLRERVGVLRSQIVALNSTTASVNVAQGLDDSVTSFLDKAQKQILSIQASKSSLSEAQQIIFANPDIPREQREAILLAATAVDQYRKMSMEAAKATKEGTKSAKDHATAMQSMLDTHLPEVKALRDTHENLTLLIKARKDGRVSVDEYDKALKSINLTYAQSLSATKEQADMERVLLDLREQQAITQKQFMRDLESFGKGDRVRELNADLAKIEDHYRSLIEARRNSAQGLSDADLVQIKGALEKELAMVREHHDKKLERQGSWVRGAADALNTYASNAANVYGQMRSATTTMFDGMFDAASKWAMGMDVKFSDVLKSYLQMMLKMQMQSASAPFLSSLGTSLLSFLPSALSIGAGGVTANAGVLNSSLGGSMSSVAANFSFDRGGYTGPGGKYEPKGIVHAEEGVLNRDEIRALGGEQGFNALRRALKVGHSSGGMGGRPQLPPMTPAVQQQQPSIVINSTVNAAPGTNAAELDAILEQRNEELRYQIYEDMRRGRV